MDGGRIGTYQSQCTFQKILRIEKHMFKYAYPLILSVIVIETGLTSCYRMPTDDDYCTIPITNNADFKREADDLVPKVAY